MNRSLEDALRSQADPHEAEYRATPLPRHIEEARATLTERPPALLHLALAAAAGAMATLVVAGGISVGAGLLDGSRNAGGPVDTDALRPCRSADFTVRSEPWPDAPMAGGVRVILTAGDTVECVISHGYAASVTDANGQHGVFSFLGMMEPIHVRPGSAWQAGISWSTYCGSGGGRVAVPEEPVRPLKLAIGIGIAAGEQDGVPVTTSDTPIPVETHTEIAPSPCTDDPISAPFWLQLTGLSPSG
jgi:hypothetical protein